MNKNYQKGVRFERDLVNSAKKDGKIAFRSAGSHSPIDVVIIDIKTKKIEFLQAKTGTSNVPKKDKEIFENLSNEYLVKFKVMNKGRKKNAKKR